MSELDTKSLRRLAREATPGPCYAQPNELVGGWCVTDVDAPPSSGARDLADFTTEADARLLVAMRNALPDLLEALDAKSAEIERWKSLIRFGSQMDVLNPIDTLGVVRTFQSAHKDGGDVDA